MKFTHKKLSIVLTVMLIPTFFSGATLLASSLEVYHITGEVMIDGQPYKRFDENNRVELEMAVGNTYYVKIMDNNPFLFTYDSKVVVKDSKNYLLFKEYMESFQEMTTFFSKKADSEAKTLINNIKGVVKNIEDSLEERTGIIDATINSDEALQKAREGVNDDWNLSKWEKILNVSYAALKKYVNSETKFMISKSKVESAKNEGLHLYEQKKDIESKLRLYKMQLEVSADEKATTDEEKTKKKETRTIRENKINELEAKLVSVEKDLKAPTASYNLAMKDLSAVQRTAISLIAQEDVLRNALSELMEFEKVLGEVHNGKQFKGNIDGKDTRKQKIDTITIAVNPQFNDLLSVNAKKRQRSLLGERIIIFNPKSYVEFRKAAGVIYSFVENPEYKVVKDENGNSIISQSSNDYNEFGGALTLNIIPTFMYGSTFEPFMQLGAAADSDSVGGLLGGGVSFFPYPDGNGNLVSSFTLSGGVIYQQVDELANGLHVGDSLSTSRIVTEGSRTSTVTTHNELKTETKWDAGMYLMFGVNF